MLLVMDLELKINTRYSIFKHLGFMFFFVPLRPLRGPAQPPKERQGCLGWEDAGFTPGTANFSCSMFKTVSTHGSFKVLNPTPQASFRECHPNACWADLPDNDKNFVERMLRPSGGGDTVFWLICPAQFSWGGCVGPVCPTQCGCCRMTVNIVFHFWVHFCNFRYCICTKLYFMKKGVNHLLGHLA